jgi:phosphosulfolactate synthase (CoM biosynthesis protein A)
MDEPIIEQAKEMEKEQIVNFADKYDAYIVQGGTLTAEQYYNEKFNHGTMA